MLGGGGSQKYFPVCSTGLCCTYGGYGGFTGVPGWRVGHISSQENDRLPKHQRSVKQNPTIHHLIHMHMYEFCHLSPKFEDLDIQKHDR